MCLISKYLDVICRRMHNTPHLHSTVSNRSFLVSISKTLSILKDENIFGKRLYQHNLQIAISVVLEIEI